VRHGDYDGPASPAAAFDGAGKVLLNTAFRTDLAAAAALLDDRHLGQAYDFTGPLWTHEEIAADLGVTCREVSDDGPGPIRWLNAQVRAGALEREKRCADENPEFGSRADTATAVR
jgi:hypothetical protein